MYQESLCQISVQWWLLTALLTSLLPLPCIPSLLLSHTAHLASLVSLGLESLVLVRQLAGRLALHPALLWSGLVSSLLYPAVAGTQLTTPPRPCWTDPTRPASLGLLCPAVVLALVTLISLAATLVLHRPAPTQHSRADTLTRLRGVLLVQLCLVLLHGGAGLLVPPPASLPLHLTLLASRPALSLAALARTLLDTQLLARIKRGYLKCGEASSTYGRAEPRPTVFTTSGQSFEGNGNSSISYIIQVPLSCLELALNVW